jgi:hypothetical protein
MNATYLATARLLTDIAPTVFESGHFALKGGTAINLFLRDMPVMGDGLGAVGADAVEHAAPTAVAISATGHATRRQ